MKSPCFLTHRAEIKIPHTYGLRSISLTTCSLAKNTQTTSLPYIVVVRRILSNENIEHLRELRTAIIFSV